MVIVYLPASSLPAGKLNSPFSLVTTVWVMVEPSFLALTRTPSIRPSSAEDTLPLSGEPVCACATAAHRAPLRLTHVTSNNVLSRIVSSRIGLGVQSCHLMGKDVAMVWRGGTMPTGR